MTAHTNIQADAIDWRSLPTYAQMWAACKGTADQHDCLERIAVLADFEHAASGDRDLRELHVCAYDAAYSSDSDEERDAFIEGMEDIFARWQADEDRQAAAWVNERRNYNKPLPMFRVPL